MKKCLLTLSGLILAAGTCFGQYADDGFNPNANGTVYAIIVQPDGKLLLGGEFDTLGGVALSGIARVLVNGQLDTSFDPGDGADSDVVNTLALQTDGKVIVGGTFDAFADEGRNHIARLNSDGSLDASFDPGANGDVEVLAVQADGKIIVGGNFANLGGQIRTFIGRLNADGSLDTAFNVTADATVYALAVQPDGKIVVGGDFTLMGDENHRGIARLNPDGSLDTSFWVTNANNSVRTLAIQADGKIVVGGIFTQLNGQDRKYIARLNADGSLDTFNPGGNSSVHTVTLQPDGKLLVGGAFTTLGGGARARIGRLNPDGTLDTSFESPGGAINTVFALAVQADNSVLGGGYFHNIGGVDRNHIARLYPDGRTDANFLDKDTDPTLGASDTVYALAQQPDWRLLAGGEFLDISGSARMRLARLEMDGSLDAAFNPLADSSARTIVVQFDGKILLGGFFTHLDVPEYKYIARLDTANNPEADFHPDPDGAVRCILPLTKYAVLPAVCRIRFEKCCGDLGPSAGFPTLRIQRYSATVGAPASSPSLPCFFESRKAGTRIQHTVASLTRLPPLADTSAFPVSATNPVRKDVSAGGGSAQAGKCAVDLLCCVCIKPTTQEDGAWTRLYRNSRAKSRASSADSTGSFLKAACAR